MVAIPAPPMLFIARMMGLHRLQAGCQVSAGTDLGTHEAAQGPHRFPSDLKGEVTRNVSGESLAGEYCVSLHRSEDEVVAAPIKYILVKKELDFHRLQVRFLVELVHLAT